MARDLRPKGKIERREGVKLFLKGDKSWSAKSPLVKRPYAPGQHGPATKGRNKLSGYGTRLREKQRAKRMYRLLERQFSNYFKTASKMSGDTSENMMKLLETRLDNIVYRLGLASSRDQARQLVTHGHFNVNGKKLTIPSASIKVGDEVAIRPSHVGKKYWQDALSKTGKQEIPGWLTFDKATFTGKMVAMPKKEEMVQPFDVQLIIEYYSR